MGEGINSCESDARHWLEKKVDELFDAIIVVAVVLGTELELTFSLLLNVQYWITFIQRLIKWWSAVAHDKEGDAHGVYVRRLWVKFRR